MLFNHNIVCVPEPIDTELSNEGKEHMKTHSKLILYMVWMTMHELLHPGTAREFGGMVGLLPVVGTRVEIDSKEDRVGYISTHGLVTALSAIECIGQVLTWQRKGNRGRESTIYSDKVPYVAAKHQAVHSREPVVMQNHVGNLGKTEKTPWVMHYYIW